MMNTLGHREHRPLEPSARLWKSHHQAFDVFQRLFSNRGGVEMPVASADRIELYTTSIIDNDRDSKCQNCALVQTPASCSTHLCKILNLQVPYFLISKLHECHFLRLA